MDPTDNQTQAVHDAINATDKKWINALRRFMGNGWGPVPFYRALNGSVDADKTVEAAFLLYNIKPKGEPSGKG